MTSEFRDKKADAKVITEAELIGLNLEVSWRDQNMLLDRTGEPLARAAVVKGMNGLFPAYIFGPKFVIFDHKPYEEITEAAEQAVIAMRSIILNE